MAQPRYTFDPVTQTYTRIDTDAPVQPVRGLGPLYDAGGGDAVAGPTGPGPSMTDPGMAEMGVGLQNFGQHVNQMSPLGMIASPGLAVTSAISGAIGNAMMGSQVSPVANPTAPVETAIAPNAIAGLAEMTEDTDQDGTPDSEDAAPEGGVGVGPAVADNASVAAVADSVAAAVADANAAAGNTSSDTSSGGGGGGGDATAGVGSEAGHAADGNNSGGGGGGGDPDGNGTGEGGGWAAGGLASARKTENMGRGNDTMLVHMTPNEVRGLQAIAMAHGGSLTINPKTGLVEAGFLDSILPMVAGAALAATGVGAPMAALMVGGGTALFTGSLEKGLMAGLGAFGGAGIGAGLASAGATAPAVTGTTQGLAAQGAAGAQAAQAAATPSAFQAAASNIDPALLETMSAQQVASTMPAASQLQLAGQGAQNLMTEGGRNAFAAGVKEATGLGVKPILGAAAAPVLGSMFSAEEKREPGKKPQEYIRPYSYDMKPEAEVNPDFAYRTGKPGESTAEQRYFTPTFTPMGVFKAGTEPGGSFYGAPTKEQYALYSGPRTTGLALAAGGIAKGGLKDGAFIVSADVVSHLGNGSNDAGQKLLARGLGARPIKGKGDGMSDSIPTSIEGKQPARVADGEAYIPPEVVKKVGAKRLYSMMDKIRHARTGTKQQAPQVDARKFIPA